MSESSAIFDAATACRHVFRTAIMVPRLMQQEWSENRLADFNHWATGAGAFTKGKASLDYRLRTNREAHSILVNLLLMLKILVQKCIDGACDEDTAVGVSSDELGRMRDIEDSLNRLTRLTIAIRKAGTRSQIQRADGSFDPNAPQIRSLRRHLELLLLVYPDENGCSDPSKQRLDTARLTPIQLRLIDANLRRRNRFLYAQRHARKLEVHSRNPERAQSEEAPVLVKQPPRSGGKRTSIKDDFHAHSITTATNIDEPIVFPPKQVPRSTTTAVSATSSRISYPKPPPLHDDQKVFKCPCCCQSLPTAVARGSQWKKHLMGDILPYTCTVENCRQTATFYPSKETWLSHMDKEHGGTSRWVCHACSQKDIFATFEVSTDFTAHLEQQHSKGIKPQQIPMLQLAWRRKVPLKIPACPLCAFDSDDQSLVLDHTAEHIHSFSLRSLPWAPTERLGQGEMEAEYDDDHCGTYFKQYPYFDISSNRSELSSSSLGRSSPARSSGDISPSRESANHVDDQQQQLTEHLLDQLPPNILGETNTTNWLATLCNDLEGQDLSPTVEDSSVTVEIASRTYSVASDEGEEGSDTGPGEQSSGNAQGGSSQETERRMMDDVDSLELPTIGEREHVPSHSSSAADLATEPNHSDFQISLAVEEGLNSPSATRGYDPEDRLGMQLAARLELTSILGVGASSVIYKALDIHTNLQYAVKAHSKIGLDPRRLKFLHQEIKLHHMASQHPNVVSVVRVMDSIDCTYVVMEFCPEGDLFAAIVDQGFFVGNDPLAKRVFLQLLDAVEFCHSIGIYHRDLKPENILLKDHGLAVLLGDFSLATTEYVSTDFSCGSAFYMSPECQQPHPRPMTHYLCAPNDVWSLGVILVNLTCGRNPWKRASVEDSTFRAYLRDPSFLLKILPLSTAISPILNRIFECDPSKRITIPELRSLILDCPSFTTNTMATGANNPPLPVKNINPPHLPSQAPVEPLDPFSSSFGDSPSKRSAMDPDGNDQTARSSPSTSESSIAVT